MKSAPLPVPTLIARKRDGGALGEAEIRAVIAGAVAGNIPDYQLSALLMAIVWRGMTAPELVTWTEGMIASGDRMALGDVPGRKIDKHSTGGVGDKISLCLAPLVAACGVPVPMMAGRELREAIDVLRGVGPDDVRATVRLGAEMLVLGRCAKDRAAGARSIESAITSGAGLERLALCVRLQGGDARVIEDPARLPRARVGHVVRALRTGVVVRVDAGLLGRAATLLGAGRLRKEDPVDAGAGITLAAKVGTRVARGDAVCTVRCDDGARWAAARPLVSSAFRIGSGEGLPGPLVLETIA